MAKRWYLFWIFVIVTIASVLLSKTFMSATFFHTHAVLEKASVNISIDAFPPDVIIFSPLPTNYSTSSVDLSYSAYDSGSGIDSVWYSLDAGANTSLSSNVTLTGLINGIHTLHVYANDSAGFENGTEYVTFEVAVTSTGPTGPTGGVSSGGSSSTRFSEVQATPRFNVYPALINVKLDKGSTDSKTFVIENIGDYLLEVVIDLGTLKKFALLSDYALEILPKQSREVTAMFNMPSDADFDVYPGRILVRSGQVAKAVNVIIEAASFPALFDAKLSIPYNYKHVAPGDDVLSKITIINMGGPAPVDVTLDYIIKDMNGQKVHQSHESLAVNISLSFSKRVTPPSNIPAGDYILYIRVGYEGSVATASDMFSVVDKAEPLGAAQQLSQINIRKLIVVLCIMLLLIILVYLLYKKKLELELIKSPDNK